MLNIKRIAFIPFSMLIVALAACSSTQSLTIGEKEGYVIDLPVRKTYVFEREDRKAEVRHRLANMTQSMVSEIHRASVVSTTMAQINELPKQLKKTVEASNTEQIDHEVLRKALDIVIRKKADKVFTHKNTWTHKNAWSSNRHGVKLLKAKDTQWEYRLLYVRDWKWPGKWSQATGYFYVNLLVEQLPKVNKDTIPVRLTIQSIEKEVPKALKLRTVAEIEFHTDVFFETMALLPKAYLDWQQPTVKNPYPDRITPILTHAQRTASSLRMQEIEEEKRANEQFTRNFRSNLQPGDSSNCGLVIEVKPPIAHIQTRNGDQWIRVDNLYPTYVGQKCRL